MKATSIIIALLLATAVQAQVPYFQHPRQWSLVGQANHYREVTECAAPYAAITCKGIIVNIRVGSTHTRLMASDAVVTYDIEQRQMTYLWPCLRVVFDGTGWPLEAVYFGSDYLTVLKNIIQ